MNMKVKGSMTLETTIVFSSVFMILVLLLVIGTIIYTNTFDYYVTVGTTNDIAFYYHEHRLQKDEYGNLVVSPTVKFNIFDDVYFGQDWDCKSDDSCAYSVRLFEAENAKYSSLFSNSTQTENYVDFNHVSKNILTLKYFYGFRSKEYDASMALGFFTDNSKDNKIEARNLVKSINLDPMETMRMMDVGSDTVEYIDEKYFKGGIDGFADNVKSKYNELNDWLEKCLNFSFKKEE